MNFQAMTYVAGDTPVHRCDARVKIVALFVYSLAIFWVSTWWGMLAFAALALAAMLVAKIPARNLVVPLVPIFVLAAFAVVFACAADPGWEGLLRGLFVALRMIVLVAASFVVCLTTTSTQLVKAFAQLISPLRALRVPVDDIAFTLSLAIRFIPVIAEEFALVRRAQKTRGASMEGLPFRRRLRIWGAAFSAVFVGLFRRADAVATAMDSRCYGMLKRNK